MTETENKEKDNFIAGYHQCYISIYGTPLDYAKFHEHAEHVYESWRKFNDVALKPAL